MAPDNKAHIVVSFRVLLIARRVVATTYTALIEYVSVAVTKSFWRIDARTVVDIGILVVVASICVRTSKDGAERVLEKNIVIHF